jgi:hypothetical protein
MWSKRFRHLSLSVLIAVLSALPVGAQNFTFDSVTCINYGRCFIPVDWVLEK